MEVETKIEVTPEQVEEICLMSSRYGAFMQWFNSAALHDDAPLRRAALKAEVFSEEEIEERKLSGHELLNETPDEDKEGFMKEIYQEFIGDSSGTNTQKMLINDYQSKHLWDTIEGAEKYRKEAIEDWREEEREKKTISLKGNADLVKRLRSLNSF